MKKKLLVFYGFWSFFVFVGLLGISLFALPVSAQAFGTQDYSVEQVFSFAFQGSDPFFDFITTDEGGYRYMDTDSSQVFIAPVNLPSGITIDFIGLDYCDSNATSGDDWTLKLVDMFGDHQSTVVGTITPPTRTGCGFAYNSVPFGYQYATNHEHHLALYAVQNDTLGDGSMSFRGAEISYKRKISPAPATATFNDVPISHPFFQYVEALVDSGITAGCGGGNYCPDNPVTRGQMAVFLSRALGLHWPN